MSQNEQRARALRARLRFVLRVFDFVNRPKGGDIEEDLDSPRHSFRQDLIVDPEEVEDLQDYDAENCRRGAEEAGPFSLLRFFHLVYDDEWVPPEEFEEVSRMPRDERRLEALDLVHGAGKCRDLHEATQEGKDEIDGGHEHLNQAK